VQPAYSFRTGEWIVLSIRTDAFRQSVFRENVWTLNVFLELYRQRWVMNSELKQATFLTTRTTRVTSKDCV
jgi:hypothetical protein